MGDPEGRTSRCHSENPWTELERRSSGTEDEGRQRGIHEAIEYLDDTARPRSAQDFHST